MLFSSEPYTPTHTASNSSSNPDAIPADATGNIALAHITNYARNNNGWVWCLERLSSHMGSARFDQLWAAVERATATALAAAYSPMQEAHAWLR